MTSTTSVAFKDANFPMDANGRTYHVGTRLGEVANRIICVGDNDRANQLSAFLDKPAFGGLFHYTSKRHFTTITGTYKGVPVSIVAIGMGTPMMDFFVREVRAVVKGPICIVRFGSCGSIGDAKLGQIAVASKGAIMVQRNVDYFSSAIHDSSDCRRQVGESAYKLSKVFIPHPTLSETLYTALAKNIGAENVCSVLNVTADSFYSSQGRLDPHFRDENQDLIKTVKERYPDAGTLEMETFMLFHLAHCTTAAAATVTTVAAKDTCTESSTSSIPTRVAPIYASGCAMIFAERFSNDFISPEKVKEMQAKGGLSCIQAVTLFEFPK